MHRLASITLVVFFAAAFTPGTARETRAVEGASEQDAWKARHAARVAAELAARDTAHLTRAQQAERRGLLEALRAYGQAGRFAQNESYPGEAIPHLIDANGNRCALANLIDISGEGPLLQRLAIHHNTAFVPELQADPALGAWLTRHGLSVEEAAYIQGPGFFGPPPGWRQSDEEDTPPGIPPDPSERTTRDSSQSGTPAPAEPDVPGSTPTSKHEGTSLTQGGGGTRRRARTASLSWKVWWQLNRPAYLNLRKRYHDAVVVTGEGTEASAGRRPTEQEIDATVIPLLKRIATSDDKRVRTTALMAWARAARGRHAPEVIAAVKTFIADHDNSWREVMVLALGIVRHPDALPTLRAIARDTREGRRALRHRGALGPQVRALAVVALGISGQPAALADIQAVLDDPQVKSNDVRACAVMALGSLSRDVDASQRRRIEGYLVKALRKGAWPEMVLAQIPTALARLGEPSLLVPSVQPMLERFRKPTAVRQSGALALATATSKDSLALLDTLFATARRDPDDAARRFGIVALGELAFARAKQRSVRRDEAVEDKLSEAKLRSYYNGAFAGRNTQKTDVPWLCLSAALFGRSYVEQRDWVRIRLERVASQGGSKDREAAAIVALGLLGDVRSLPMLRAKQAKAKDKLTRSYLAEAMGILGDRSQREALLELVRKDGDGEVRYRAALGLGFSADPRSLHPIVDAFASTNNRAALRALARVIGELGDRRALPTLIRIANDPEADTWSRRRALSAIGMIGQQADHAWTLDYQRGVNFTIATPTLRTLLALY